MTPKARTTYWKRFNALGRFVGVWFIVIGGIVFLYALSQGDWLAICFTALGPAFGVLLLCARPYRPDLRDLNSPDDSTNTK
jgi:hypothetical protein